MWLLLSIMPIVTYAQVELKDIDIINNSFSIIIENNCRSEIKYNNSKEWIAKTFGDYKKVIQYEDAENHKIIMKGESELEHGHEYANTTEIPILKYTITIECKNDKYRVQMENMGIEETIIRTTPKELAVLIGYSEDRNTVKYSMHDVCNPDSTKWMNSIYTLEENKEVLIENMKGDISKKKKKEILSMIDKTEKEINSIKLSISSHCENMRILNKKVQLGILELINSLDSSICKSDTW